MEGQNEQGGLSPFTWFVVGLWTAIILEEVVVPTLSRILYAFLEVEPTNPEPIVYSENGITGEKGESVTSLVKEESSNE